LTEEGRRFFVSIVNKVGGRGRRVKIKQESSLGEEADTTNEGLGSVVWV
jgi:hypothetical protein